MCPISGDLVSTLSSNNSPNPPDIPLDLALRIENQALTTCRDQVQTWGARIIPQGWRWHERATAQDDRKEGTTVRYVSGREEHGGFSHSVQGRIHSGPKYTSRPDPLLGMFDIMTGSRSR